MVQELSFLYYLSLHPHIPLYQSVPLSLKSFPRVIYILHFHSPLYIHRIELYRLYEISQGALYTPLHGNRFQRRITHVLFYPDRFRYGYPIGVDNPVLRVHPAVHELFADQKIIPGDYFFGTIFSISFRVLMIFISSRSHFAVAVLYWYERIRL